MKKHLIPKSLVKKLHGKKQKKTAQNLERRIKSSLLERATLFAKEVRGIEGELLALTPQLTQHWLWLADIKQVGYCMDRVLELLEKANSGDNATSEAGAENQPGESAGPAD